MERAVFYDWEADDFLLFLKEQGKDPEFGKAFLSMRKYRDFLQEEIDGLKEAEEEDE